MIVATNLPSPFRFRASGPFHVEALFYHNRRTALRLIQTNSGELYTTLTINLEDENCPRNEVFIKNYSENLGIEQYLLTHNIITGTPTYIAASSFVSIPRYKLHPDIVRNLDSLIESNSQ